MCDPRLSRVSCFSYEGTHNNLPTSLFSFVRRTCSQFEHPLRVFPARFAQVLWRENPLRHVSRDVEVEVLQRGVSGEHKGAVVGVHDPPMGWSAYGQTLTAPLVDAEVVALRASARA
eukprot:5486251-Pleurochrysis_carterae.AAC.1